MIGRYNFATLLKAGLYHDGYTNPKEKLENSGFIGSTTMSYRIGIGQRIFTTTSRTAGARFQFDSATYTHWKTITRQASTSTAYTTADTMTACNWYQLEGRGRSGGNWEFYVNNNLRFTHSANQPTTACNVGAMVQTATRAVRNSDIDYFRLSTSRISQRWT